MAIDLILKALQALVGSQVVADKAQRNEHVIRLLQRLGLDPEHPPADFEGVYAYALVKYGYGKPEACLAIFREAEIRRCFREAFGRDDGAGWMREGERFLESSVVGDRVRAVGADARRELAEFAECFVGEARRSRMPGDVLLSHQVAAVKAAVQQVAGQVAGMAQQQVMAAGQVAAIEPGAHCRAGALAEQMRAWFEVLGYRFESYAVWEADWFEWVIAVPVRRGRYDRVLVRGMDGEVGIRDVRSLAESVAAQRADEGWVVTMRRVSQAARAEVEGAEGLAAFTLDELLDQEASFDLYLDWLEEEIERRGIEARYVPIACTKEEVDAVTHQRLGVSRYGEADGWTEGYIDRWLDDPVKEHLSVLGEFGTGKTWLSLHYAAGALRRYRDAQGKGMARPRLPIVIPLRDYAKAVSVESLFSEFFFRQHKLPIPHYDAFIQLNRMGKLLLIFDGFDEMAARVDKQQMINNFWELAKVVVPGSKVILTCRTEHFPEAREGRALLNAELQASTRGLSGETPQFEVLELEKLEPEQIRRVLGFSASEETVGLVMGNAQLLDLARRPVMTELILEALPDIEAGKPVDMSRVYLYAVRRKMERDIKAERTFTSMADKLYFLCELSWEMLSNDRMSLNYREFPDRIRKLFGAAVQEEKDLDHWHFDMMGQTMLIRNAEGDYTPAHRSLLEFFVAFKFAAELGALAPDFLELAQMKSGIDRSLEAREYSWSEYFGGGAIAPLLGFRTESLEGLRSGFGKEILTRAIKDLLVPILKDCLNAHNLLKQVVLDTASKSFLQAGFVGGNSATLGTILKRSLLSNIDLSNTILCGADFSAAILRDTILRGASLEQTKFPNAFGSIFAIAYSPDGEMFATTGSSCGINVWRKEEPYPFLTLHGHLEWVRALVFSPDGKTLFSASFDKTVRSWNIENGQAIHVYGSHTSRINDVAISSNFNYLASASDDLKIQIWDPLAGSGVCTLKGHEKAVEAVLFGESEHILISGGSDGLIKVWDISKALCISTLIGHEDRVLTLAISHDNQFLASAGTDGSIRMWDLRSESCLLVLDGHTDRISSLDFDASNQYILSSSYDRTIKIWCLRTGALLKTLSGHTDWIRAARFCPDQESIISGGDDQSIRLWNLNSGECTSSIQGTARHIRALSISVDDKILAIGNEDKSIILWKNIDFKDLSKSFEIVAFKAHEGRLNSTQISSDTRLLATGSFDRTVRIWDLSSEQCLVELKHDSGCVNSVAFTSDNKKLITAGADCIVRIWDVASGECLSILEGHQDWIWSVAVDSDDALIATAGEECTIRIWDFATNTCKHILKGHCNGIQSILFIPETQTLISAGLDAEIKIWDAGKGALVNTMVGHTNAILALSISRANNLLASAGQDQTIRIWDIERGECINTFLGHKSGIRSIAFTSNGENLISGDFARHIKIWDVLTGKCLKTFQTITNLGRMNITGVKGLNESTIASLKALGAIEDEEVRETVE